jgi:hypothetical protein
MAGLTETSLRSAFEAYQREGPEALRPVFDPKVIWTAADQPGYDCVGVAKVIEVLSDQRADGSAGELRRVSVLGADRFEVELEVTLPDGTRRLRRITLSSRDGLITRMEGRPVSSA